MRRSTRFYPMTRRKFIQRTLASMVVGFGGVSAYQYYLQGQATPLQKENFEYQFLKMDDRILLQVLIPVFVAENGSEQSFSIEQINQNIDAAIIRLPLRTQAELRELFDLLGSGFGRLLVARVWSNWQATNYQSIDDFLNQWRESSIGLLQIAYKGLHKIIIGSYYAEASSWDQISYPGPPKLGVQ